MGWGWLGCLIASPILAAGVGNEGQEVAESAGVNISNEITLYHLETFIGVRTDRTFWVSGGGFFFL